MTCQGDYITRGPHPVPATLQTRGPFSGGEWLYQCEECAGRLAARLANYPTSNGWLAYTVMPVEVPDAPL